MDDEDLFGDDNDDEQEQPTRDGNGRGDEDDGIFDDDDDVRVKTSFDDAAAARKRAHFADDDGSAEMDVADSFQGGKQADELDDLFGEEGSSSPIKAVSKPRSTSNLRITDTKIIPESITTVLVRMPNVLKIQEKDFDADTYNSEEDKQALGKMAVGIRWRFKRDSEDNFIMGADGKYEMESNARLVKLKKGGYQIIVGENVYECLRQKLENRCVIIPFIGVQRALRSMPPLRPLTSLLSFSQLLVYAKGLHL